MARIRAARLLGVFLIAGCSRSGGRGEPASSGDRADGKAPPSGQASSPVKSVALGTLHSCALHSDGKVSCWGSNDQGQLGAPADDECVVEDLLHNVMPPRRTACRETPAFVTGIGDAVEIAAAGATSCARLRSGSVECWGGNAMGQVGDGTTSDRGQPTRVVGVGGALQIDMSVTHACALVSDGHVMCWGGNFFAELGTTPQLSPGASVSRDGYGAVKVLTPAIVPNLDGVVEVRVGEHLTCARREDQSVRCFGRFAQGTSGSSAPIVVPELRGAVSLALGQGSHSGILADGSVRAWGANSARQLLDGTRDAQKVPVVSQGLPPLRSMAWTVGRACAVTRAGGVLCWGNSGQNTVDSPKPVALGTKVTSIALGANHACAVGSDGSVWCWGDGFYGATGSRAGAAVPTSGFWRPPRRVIP